MRVVDSSTIFNSMHHSTQQRRITSSSRGGAAGKIVTSSHDDDDHEISSSASINHQLKNFSLMSLQPQGQDKVTSSASPRSVRATITDATALVKHNSNNKSTTTVESSSTSEKAMTQTMKEEELAHTVLTTAPVSTMKVPEAQGLIKMPSEEVETTTESTSPTASSTTASDTSLEIDQQQGEKSEDADQFIDDIFHTDINLLMSMYEPIPYEKASVAIDNFNDVEAIMKAIQIVDDVLADEEEKEHKKENNDEEDVISRVDKEIMAETNIFKNQDCDEDEDLETVDFMTNNDKEYNAVKTNGTNDEYKAKQQEEEDEKDYKDRSSESESASSDSTEPNSDDYTSDSEHNSDSDSESQSNSEINSDDDYDDHDNENDDNDDHISSYHNILNINNEKIKERRRSYYSQVEQDITAYNNRFLSNEDDQIEESIERIYKRTSSTSVTVVAQDDIIIEAIDTNDKSIAQTVTRKQNRFFCYCL